ncbi:ABC transporter permease [Vibrio coralliilyticus]|uniref:ABC transporter permease n=1 Tax=Vibrio coralliilyticus TaxID=190893 RepID=UPI0015600D9B|nr:ABC transporter permease [Vibrio coralliilyticus]NRF14152.1 ABC transporter permease [Vibrio coralliilyticus]
MSSVVDISWPLLALFFCTLTIPVLISRYYRLNIEREALISVARMTVQLLLVGVYLQYLFTINSLLVNVLWLLVMTLIGASSIISKAKLPRKPLMYPVTAGLLVGLLPILILICVVIVQPQPLFNAQYLIPLAGMLLGNSLSGNIVALQNMFTSIDTRRSEYEAALALGASPHFATLPFVRESIKKSLAPTLASMTTSGLVTLPGMMTGQILGGASPLIAIKYQLMIMVAIFVMLSVSISLTLSLSVQSCINKEGRVLVGLDNTPS